MASSRNAATKGLETKLPLYSGPVMAHLSSRLLADATGDVQCNSVLEYGSPERFGSPQYAKISVFNPNWKGKR